MERWIINKSPLPISCKSFIYSVHIWMPFVLNKRTWYLLCVPVVQNSFMMSVCRALTLRNCYTGEDYIEIRSLLKHVYRNGKWNHKINYIIRATDVSLLCIFNKMDSKEIQFLQSIGVWHYLVSCSLKQFLYKNYES